jgi:energy-coupling factor transporter ATP-binding protein EcfA2
VDVKEVIKMIDDLVFAKEGRWLEKAEKIVIEAAWLDIDYKEIAENVPCDFVFLQRRVAPKLWVLLTGIVGDGEKVTKKRLRRILEKQMPDLRSGISDELSNGLAVIGGHLPNVSKFYGRRPEMAMLKELVTQERCVALIGQPGIGKSALIAKMIEVMRVASVEFEGFIWKSVSYSPLLPELLADLLNLLADSENHKLDLSQSSQDRALMFFEQLQLHRYLVVLDSAEALLQGDRNTDSSPYGDKYADYEGFFRSIIEKQHQSCIVLTSREPFIDINRLQHKGQPARSMKVEGLVGKEALLILKNQGLTDENDWGELVEIYRGNPLSIEMVSQRIKIFFGGSVKEFLENKTTLVTDIFQDNLERMFKGNGRLTDLEKEILTYLSGELSTFASDSISFNQLLNYLRQKPNEYLITTTEIIEALESLDERSLIERKISAEKEIFLTLQPQVRKYISIYTSKGYRYGFKNPKSAA